MTSRFRGPRVAESRLGRAERRPSALRSRRLRNGRHVGRCYEVGNREKTPRGVQIAEDLDALSLAHNLVVPPLLIAVTFSAMRLRGCQLRVIKVACGAAQSCRNV